MRILITGMEGFAGSHLAEMALVRKAEVHGTAMPGIPHKNLDFIPKAHVHALDITDKNAVMDLIRSIRPQRIYHLAGISNPTFSRKEPEITLRTNILGNLNILEACRQHARQARILIVGSADEYGGVEKTTLRIREDQPLNPDSPYAYSKVCQDLTGLAYFQQYGLHVVRVRPFNHIGPRQALGFVATDFASQIAAIELGRKEPVMDVGNLDVVRDFSDVRDIMAGYGALLDSGKPGQVYNLGSGRGTSIRDLLDGFLALSRTEIHVHIHHEKVRAERLRKVASIRRITRETGWKPKLSLAKSLRDILDDWRSRLA
jgi:GDP-4-dehydro-6-deoxy-D-mannose reductase